ncbi:MAG: hypothetical protein A2162_07295 [Deltaproteobacteria bacterium RBG_13_52_11b]|nr:MAG: hypothetical protein A2162_07295 [Deltaproteobacteria bacterium RBG_13_52_11b]
MECNIRVTAEAQRSQREMFILIRSGDGDWIRNFVRLPALGRDRGRQAGLRDEKEQSSKQRPEEEPKEKRFLTD